MIDLDGTLNYINKIADNCKKAGNTADEFLQEIVKKGIFSSFCGPFAYSILDRDKRTIIFQKVESLKPGSIAGNPKLSLSFTGLYKAERDAWTNKADWQMKEVGATFKVEYDSAKVLFSADYAFVGITQDQFKKVFLEVFKKYYTFYLIEHAEYQKEQDLARERREAQAKAIADAAAQRKEQLRQKALAKAQRQAEKDALAQMSPEERQSLSIDKHNAAFKASITAPNPIIDSEEDSFYYALGYLAATAKRLYAKVPRYIENPIAVDKAVDTFEEIFPGSDYYTVDSVTNAQGNPTQMDISCSLYTPKRAADPTLAPSYLVATDGTGLPGTASGRANEGKENAGGLRSTGQLSNNRFIHKLVKNHGFKFNAKGTSGCAPSLADLLNTVSNNHKQEVEDGYNYGLEVLKNSNDEDEEKPKRNSIKQKPSDVINSSADEFLDDTSKTDPLDQDFPDPDGSEE